MSDIVLENVSKCYGDKAVLRNFCAALPAGGRAAILGPSGAGKTTLARLLLGLEEPDSGRITGREQRFACVFQEDRLCPGLSAAENIRLVLPRPLWGQEKAALAALGLAAEDGKTPAGRLSGGEKRRVALARAVLYPSGVLLLDEPFKGLDRENKERAYAYLLEHLAGRSLLLITHDEAEARALGVEDEWKVEN